MSLSARRRVPITGLLMAALALAGCGQKGPLYLPDHNRATPVPASSSGGSAQPATSAATPPDDTVPASPDQGPPPH